MSVDRFEAPTVEAALEKAAAKLGIPAADLEHEVVETKRDFWGGGADTVVVRAWQRAAKPVAATAAPAAPTPVPPRPVEAAPEAAPAETEDLPEAPRAEEKTPPPPRARRAAERQAAAAAEREPADHAAGSDVPDDDEAGAGEGIDPETVGALLAQIFHDMEFACVAEVSADDEGILATISGDDKEALLEGNGRCLSALELIVNNAFRHKLPRGQKVRVDAGDFRSRRDDELADLAYQVAHAAKQSGQTQETLPLNAYERRLVHLALAEDPGVTTRSRGNGFLKNVEVIPTSERRPGGRGGYRGGNRGGNRGRGRA